MDHEFRNAEASGNIEDDYDRWLRLLIKLMPSGQTPDDDHAFALFEDGCTVEEAAEELRVGDHP